MDLNKEIEFLKEEIWLLFQAKQRAHSLIIDLAKKHYNTQNIILCEHGKELKIRILTDEEMQEFNDMIENE